MVTQPNVTCMIFAMDYFSKGARSSIPTKPMNLEILSSSTKIDIKRIT